MPAGLVGDDDASDTLESAARRELIEETGWDAARIDVLLVGPTTAGMSNERIAFARARDLTRVGDGGGVDDENITVHSIPRAQAPAWLRSEEHTSELQSLMRSSYAVFCLKKKNKKKDYNTNEQI